jgi:hypothetical protein
MLNRKSLMATRRQSRLQEAGNAHITTLECLT